ncbi:MAG: DegT/DnrJ/EryC1/StrS family aminotransferase [Firmicutes bacterium]|nr:DegT/DnrJ/EryC1/StrS family aminotransferase [Bacillota bacterium]
MKIRNLPWYGLGAIYEQDDIDAVLKILNPCVTEAKGFFRLPEETEFQKAFAEYEECKYASAVNSCGTGLDLALQILDIGPGDEVITTPLTFICTATCILLKGAKPVFADIDPRTYNLDPAKVEEKITERTKAVIPVHFAGLSADIEGFERLAKKYGIKVIYDSAHAVGSKYKGKKIGGFGDMSVFSFQSNKNMSTLGEGGAITTNNEEYFTRLERIKSFGFKYGPVDDVVELGSNYRMTKLQSAVGLTQLKKVDKNACIRKKFAEYLSEKLKDVEEITTPYVPEGYEHVYHLYTLLFNDEKVGKPKEEFIKILKEKYKIGVTIHYRPVYKWTVFKERGYNGDDTPITAKIMRQLFNVPVFARMQYEDFDYIAWAIKETIAELRK